MRYLSVCSGIEAASCAWHSLGWEPVAFAEIEPFPSAVLAHHYPDTPNWGDMSKFKEWLDADGDAVVGLDVARGVHLQSPDVQYVRHAPLRFPKSLNSMGAR